MFGKTRELSVGQAKLELLNIQVNLSRKQRRPGWRPISITIV